jgi:hypothetical protein
MCWLRQHRVLLEVILVVMVLLLLPLALCQ